MSSLRTEETDGVLVVSFIDERIRDHAKIEQISQELMEQIQKVVGLESKTMLLNFGGVQSISSDLMTKLILLKRKTKTDRVKLKLCSISPDVMEWFTDMQLDETFDIHSDQEKALQASDQ